MNPEKQTPPTHDNKETTKENEPSDPPDPGQTPPDPDSQTISRPGTPAQTNQITVLPSKPTPKFIIRYQPDPRIKKLLFKRPLEENEHNSISKLPKQPEPIKPNQDRPQMNRASGINTAQTQTNEPGHAPKIPTTFIHPNSYNEVLGTLMTGRVRTILGPIQEPIIFESDSESSGTEEGLKKLKGNLNPATLIFNLLVPKHLKVVILLEFLSCEKHKPCFTQILRTLQN